VASIADYRAQPAIDAPATPERVLWGVQQMLAVKHSATVVAQTEVELA
jgi:xanthine dehydrogenase large subunit